MAEVELGTHQSIGDLLSYFSTVPNGAAVTFASDTGILLEHDFTVGLGGVLSLEIPSCPNNLGDMVPEKD